MRDAEEVARRALGTLFCLRSEPASEWCHIHDTEWGAPHDHYCNEGERVVARLADAIRARDAEVAAKAWDEGWWDACNLHGGYTSCGKPDAHNYGAANPYREREGGDDA